MAEEIRAEFTKLLELVKDNFTEADIEKLKKAFELANNAHEGQKRRSGEPYIIHPLAVAKTFSFQ